MLIDKALNFHATTSMDPATLLEARESRDCEGTLSLCA